MFEIGGEKAIEIIKQNERTKQTPVLISSANADNKDNCKKVNAVGYAEKQLPINTVIQTIQRHTG